MRKVLVFFAMLAAVARVAVAADYNAVLVADMDSGKIIYAENENDLNYPASLTKIMTLYLTFDALEHGRLKLDQNLIVSKAAAAASPVKIGLSAGSKISVDDAIKAVAVYSANDIARVLAENLVGDEGGFAAMMTRVAAQIGLKNTNFSNASGLADDDHISTAKDMALLAIAVRKHYPQYWKYFSIPYFHYNGRSFKNGNGLLGVYDGCDGMKTGFTNQSKYSLIATATRGGRPLVSVVLGASSKPMRNSVSKGLLDFGFGGTKQFATDRAAVWSDEPDEGPAAPSALPSVPATKPVYDVSGSGGPNAGGAGGQFGAFGDEVAAKTQQ
ncbi:MAG: D-alanyl-D-alanine carboxypeptidase, partial [Rickettsiales bacterium]|nr:D-alanyl-D-alanine carboxypeptidase [Rickettsiales bacterium]